MDETLPQFESFNLDSHLNLLTNGNNVLAIHTLNSAANDEDFLASPRLIAGQINTNRAGFHSTPTPGAPNDSPWYLDKVADTSFDIDRGYNDAPFSINITTTTPGATIRYTTDGSDPRLPGGEISPNAPPFNPSGANVQSLISFGDSWKDLDNGSDQGTPWRSPNFNDNSWATRAGELGYNQAGTETTISSANEPVPVTFSFSFSPSELVDGENTGFLELLNTGTRPVNLRNARFTSGITYDFPRDRDTIIHPGQRLVIVGSLYDMNQLHGLGLPIAGIHKGNFSNGGELITLINENATVLSTLIYDDLSPWPDAPDGEGPKQFMRLKIVQAP